MAGFNLDNYVPVEDRIEAFYAQHPEGSIQTEIAYLDPLLVVVRATVYRAPDDPRPTTGHSQMCIPGKTPYTKDSEVENAETSAVGRALALMGFEVRRGVASRQEVRGKQASTPPERDLASEADRIVWDEFTGQCKSLAIGMKSICAALGHEATSPAEGAEWLNSHGPQALKEWLEANPDLNWSNLVSRLADQKAASQR